MDETESQPLTPVHPDHIKVMRIQSVLASLPVIMASFVAEMAIPFPPGLIIGPVLLLAIIIIFRLPVRRYRHRGYHMGDDRLRTVRGYLFHADTIVPFGRVQHIDVEQGPLQGHFGLATLVLHTAGNHNNVVRLPGLLNQDALDMRERIAAHIRRDLP